MMHLARISYGLRFCAFCRAEKSFTHRHLCEFTGLDFEMAIDQHYNEVLDMLDHLFVYIFNGLKKHCGVPSDAVQCQQGPVLSCLSSHICDHTIAGERPSLGMSTLLCQPHERPERLMDIPPHFCLPLVSARH